VTQGLATLNKAYLNTEHRAAALGEKQPLTSLAAQWLLLARSERGTVGNQQLLVVSPDAFACHHDSSCPVYTAENRHGDFPPSPLVLNAQIFIR